MPDVKQIVVVSIGVAVNLDMPLIQPIQNAGNVSRLRGISFLLSLCIMNTVCVCVFVVVFFFGWVIVR